MIEFGCHCASWQATLTQPPRALINCHCGLCRRLSGGAFSSWATVAIDDIAVIRSGPLRHYRASENATRSFCEICGTHVFTADVRLPGQRGIPAGIVAGATMPAVSGHYFVDDKPSWHEIGDSAPCFGGASGYQPVMTPRPRDGRTTAKRVKPA